MNFETQSKTKTKITKTKTSRELENEEINPFRSSGRITRSPDILKKQLLCNPESSDKAEVVMKSFADNILTPPLAKEALPASTASSRLMISSACPNIEQIDTVYVGQKNETPRTSQQRDHHSDNLDTQGGVIPYSSPKEEFILKMRASEEEAIAKCRIVIRKMRQAITKQKNISMDVQNGVSELEELLDVIGDYRKNWKGAEKDVRKKSILGKKRGSPDRHKEATTSHATNNKRIATSPPDVRPEKKHKDNTKKVGATGKSPGIPRAATTTTYENTHRKKKRRKEIKDRSDALVVKPREGHSYAEILKNLKENVKPDEAEVDVRSIRKTRDGALLLELKKGGEKDKFCDIIKDALKDSAQVKDLKSNPTIEIRDIDGFSTKEEIVIAIKKSTGAVLEDITVNLSNPNSRDQRRAFVSLPSREANKILSTERIKIGWTNCRVRYHEEPKRCFRCFGLGHMQWNCKGPDRKGQGICIRCGEEGHILRQCKNPAKCCLCSTEKGKPVDHIPGSKRCKAERKTW